VEPQFSNPFLNQLLGQQNSLDDLKNLDPEYYKHLSNLRRMTSNEIEDLGLTFELTSIRTDGSKTETVDLIPGGSSMSVTKENVIRYVHLVAHRRLNIESAKQTNAFLRGFRDLIPAAWVRLFSPNELQKLISGDDTVKGFNVSGKFYFSVIVIKIVLQYNALTLCVSRLQI
jgi:ubiquitin-protein ligase E3 C